MFISYEDDIPSLSLQPNEISEVITDAQLVEKWAALKDLAQRRGVSIRSLQAQVANLKQQIAARDVHETVAAVLPVTPKRRTMVAEADDHA